MTLLSVNVNKIAVLRNSRGEDQPDVCTAAMACIAAGADGITVHPRPDQRHIRPDDVHALKKHIAGRVEFTIEGNIFAPPRDSYPGLLALIREIRPTQCTLVPDNDTQLTSDHGFNLPQDGARLKPLIAELKTLGCRVSLFMDADVKDSHSAMMEQAAAIGADRIEIYTGPYAKAFAKNEYSEELAACVRTAERARAVGLGVNAGHDLNQANLGALKKAIPFLAEVSIGHALIGEALFAGLATTVKAYRTILAN